MIILTEAEAEKVRGVSPTDASRALQPIPIKDGNYVLNESVLDDPAHADVREFLGSLPTVKLVDPALVYDGDARPSDDVAYGARVIGKDYAAAGVRKLDVKDDARKG